MILAAWLYLQLDTAMTVTDYIKNDLRSQIQSGSSLPANPTLKSLADHYDVSVTPIRGAVRELIKERLILKRPNGRLVVKRSRLGTGGSYVKSDCPQPRKDWCRVITDDVIRLSFQGKAVYLREEATAEEYGISRTIVRQVFHRLAGSGIFEHIPHRGWRVRPIGYADIRAFFQVREALELTALDLARGHLIRADLERILADTPVRKPGELPPVDDALHKYLIAKSGNRYIQDFFNRHAGFYYYRTLFDFEHDEAEVAAAIAQHRQILEALLAEDWPRAREALSEHIRYQLPVLERMIAAVISRADNQTAKPGPESDAAIAEDA